MTTTARRAAKAPTPKRVRIHLEDQGQDFLWWDLEERDDDYSYAVVDCGPFQAWLWTEYFVEKKSVRKGHKPFISKDEKDGSFLNYPITKIEKLAPAQKVAA